MNVNIVTIYIRKLQFNKEWKGKKGKHIHERIFHVLRVDTQEVKKKLMIKCLKA